MQVALQYLNTFCLASHLAIQWPKTQCYMQSFLPALPQVLHYDQKWLQHGKIFHFLGIHFSFQALPSYFWNAVLAKIERNLAYWITKPLSLAGKFQVFSKVLAATHVYYSSCWAPSKASYMKFERLMWSFLQASRSDHHGFHRVAWEYCCLPKKSRGIGLISTQNQGLALCAKWIIKALSGEEASKILLRHYISSGFPSKRLAWKGIGLQTLLTMKDLVQIQGTFVVKSIYHAWEAIKPWL